MEIEHISKLHKKERNIIYLFISITSLSILGWYGNTITPDIWWKVLFFIIFSMIAIGSFTQYIFNNGIRTCIAMLSLCLILFIRLIGIKHMIGTITVIILMLLLDRWITSRI
jgi:hypothetical protein